MIDDTLNRVLESCGDQLINLYRTKLTQEGAIASGTLTNAISAFVQTDGEVYELCLRLQDYWKYVENGREPGTFPNLESLKKWIRIKPVIGRAYNGKLPTIDSLAFLIGRSIMRNGIKPKPLLAASLEELNKMQLIEQQVDDSIKDQINVTFNTLK